MVRWCSYLLYLIRDRTPCQWSQPRRANCRSICNFAFTLGDTTAEIGRGCWRDTGIETLSARRYFTSDHLLMALSRTFLWAVKLGTTRASLIINSPVEIALSERLSNSPQTRRTIITLGTNASCCVAYLHRPSTCRSSQRRELDPGSVAQSRHTDMRPAQSIEVKRDVLRILDLRPGDSLLERRIQLGGC
jgi:hypothetical protein